jgi:hypothetical protein
VENSGLMWRWLESFCWFFKGGKFRFKRFNVEMARKFLFGFSKVEDSGDKF